MSILGAIASAVASAASKAFSSSSGSKKSSSGGSGSSNKGSSGSSSGSSSSGVTSTPGGYAYTDKYGYSHVVKDYDTAKKYAAPGSGVYTYSGNYSGGYARDSSGNRVAVNTPGVKPYGNDIRDGQTTMFTSEGLGGIASAPSLIPNLSSSYAAPTATQNNPLIPQLPQQLNQTSYFDKNYGGLDNYVSSQQSRYRQALSSGNTDLVNRLVSDAMRVGYSLTPQTPASQQIGVQAQQQTPPLIPEVPAMEMPIYDIPKPPEYNVYQPREFDPNRDWEAPDVPSRGVSWVPTNKARDAFNQSEQNRYNASLNSYNAQRQDWSDLQNIQWQQYQEQQRQQERQEGLAREEQAAKAKQALALQEMAMDIWTKLGYANSFVSEALGIPEGTSTLDAAYKDATLQLNQSKYELDKWYKQGNLDIDWYKAQNSNQPDTGDQQKEALGLFMSASEMYKTGEDYLADVRRNKGQLIQILGTSGYAQLEKDAVSMSDSMRTGTKFKPGSASPIKELLTRISVNPSSPTSAGGSINSWAEQAAQIAGVGSDWIEPLKKLAQKESGGNPEAVNPQKVWYSKQHGYQNAKGVMQMMEPTFNAYKVKGYDNIFDPVSNMVASINYIKANYGHPSKVLANWEQRGGY